MSAKLTNLQRVNLIVNTQLPDLDTTVLETPELPGYQFRLEWGSLTVLAELNKGTDIVNGNAYLLGDISARNVMGRPLGAQQRLLAPAMRRALKQQLVDALGHHGWQFSHYDETEDAEVWLAPWNLDTARRLGNL
jgi:hypothetical protein